MINYNTEIKFNIYKRKDLFKGPKSYYFIVIGEIGNFKRKEYVVSSLLETDSEVKIYPLGTHVPFKDRLVGYVLIDYRRIAKIYKSRFAYFIRRK